MNNEYYPEKCGIFIDGGYFRSKLKELRISSLDLFKLSEKISQLIRAKRLRTYYYDYSL